MKTLCGYVVHDQLSLVLGCSPGGAVNLVFNTTRNHLLSDPYPSEHGWMDDSGFTALSASQVISSQAANDGK